VTAQEKAKCGLWLLREATLNYLATRPEGATASEVRKALGLDLDSDAEGKHKYYLFWGLQNLLAKEDKVEGRDNLLFLVSQPEAKA